MGNYYVFFCRIDTKSLEISFIQVYINQAYSYRNASMGSSLEARTAG